MLKRLRGLLVALLMCIASAPASAQQPCAAVSELDLTEVDEGRLNQLVQSRERGIRQALQEGGEEARQTIAAFFRQGLTPAGSIPVGQYQCRTVKLGGEFGGFTAYGFFSCRVSERDGRLVIEKLSGSQRFKGELIEVGGALAFRGAGHYADEEPRTYGDDAERNAVGCLSRVAADTGSYLLELPMPFLESLHDVIELKPQK